MFHIHIYSHTQTTVSQIYTTVATLHTYMYIKLHKSVNFVKHDFRSEECYWHVIERVQHYIGPDYSLQRYMLGNPTLKAPLSNTKSIYSW